MTGARPYEAALASARQELHDQVAANRCDVFNAYPMEDTVARLADSPLFSNYCHLTPGAEAIFAAVHERYGEPVLSLYSKALLIDLIARFTGETENHRYSPAIVTQFEANFRRIIDEIRNGARGYYQTQDDIFFKDLAICRQKLVPAGAEVFEPHSGFSRSVVKAGGVGQAVRFLAALAFDLVGHHPLYQYHTHLATMEDFSKEGFDRFYVRVAEMLELNPNVRGLFANSWFYDPILEDISPRLTYLRTVPETNGGRIFYVGPDDSGSALSKSPTRQRLAAEGRYHPKKFMIVWSRKALIAWARANR